LKRITFFFFFDIRMSLHRNIIPNYSQKDATFLDLCIFTNALHVSGGGRDGTISSTVAASSSIG